MNEFDPTNREHINISPLRRFEEDIAIAETYADLYITLSRYMAEEFNIPDHQVHLMLTPDEELLPSTEVFEQNPVIAREQARLVLMKLALPLAEYVIEDIDGFTSWVTKTARVALGTKGSQHAIETCMSASHGSASHSCTHSQVCPVKFTAYTLISDAGRLDKSDLEYSDAFKEAKMARTLAKIEVARSLGLFSDESAKIMAQGYVRRCYSQ